MSKHHALIEYGGVETKLHAFLTSLGRGELISFTLRPVYPCTHLNEVCVSPHPLSTGYREKSVYLPACTFPWIDPRSFSPQLVSSLTELSLSYSNSCMCKRCVGEGSDSADRLYWMAYTDIVYTPFRIAEVSINPCRLFHKCYHGYCKCCIRHDHPFTCSHL